MTPEFEKLLSALPGATTLVMRRDGYWMTAPKIDVAAMATLMRQHDGRLSTVTGIDRADGETDLIYHYVVGHDEFNIKACTTDQTITSITNITLAADWIEREIFDIYGVTFTGHPNLAPLLRPAGVPQGFFRREG